MVVLGRGLALAFLALGGGGWENCVEEVLERGGERVEGERNGECASSADGCRLK